ncbi:MAG TPA: hypothetical protein VFP12_00910 [Allosphingosinicella sp.]|nr:hypothetical protein [Allosphingosinicella sp.]
MRKVDLAAWGLQQHIEKEKHDGRALLFGALLILIHLLNVQPAEISAAGLKIQIEDVAVLRGVFAFIFLYFAYRSILSRGDAYDYYPVYHPYAELRREIIFARRGKNHNKSAQEIKAKARSQKCFEDAIKAPFYIGITVVVLSALLLAVTDCYAILLYVAQNFPRLLY